MFLRTQGCFPSLVSFAPPRQLPRIWILRGYSTSSKRWVARQRRDAFTREAKVQQFKSRAAFKLLEVTPTHKVSPANPKQLNEKYNIFRPGQTVIDLVQPAYFICQIFDFARASHQDPGPKSQFLKLNPMEGY